MRLADRVQGSMLLHYHSNFLWWDERDVGQFSNPCFGQKRGTQEIEKERETVEIY